MSVNQIYNCLERLSELLKVGARQAGAIHGLQPVQLEVLHYLSLCNCYSDTPMAVTEYLGQTKGTVSQTINVLEKKGLVRKVADLIDKRKSHIKVTSKGSKLINQHIPTKMFSDACQHLSKTKQKEITASLKLLINSVNQANNMKSFGVCCTCRYNQKLEDEGYYCKLIEAPLSESDIQLICREHEAKDNASQRKA